MRTPIGPVALMSITLLVSACAMLKPDVEVLGDYPLSLSEAQEIKSLLPPLGIHQPVYRITMQSPDRADVACGPPDIDKPDTEFYELTVVRRGGRWRALKSSITKGPWGFVS